MTANREPAPTFDPVTSERANKSIKRPLDPIERISEVWFGLVMVLTFTCTLSVKDAGHHEVRSMLIAALGCNTAWGIIDGFIYLVSSLVKRGHGISTLRALQEASEAGDAHAIIADALPPLVASVVSPAEYEAIGQRLMAVPVPKRPGLTGKDWLGAAGVFLLAFFSTFPVAIPFLLVHDPRLALRISNGIALVMLFLTGYAFGRYADYRPWSMGLWMILLGSVLVGVTIFLGG